jgi:outer membrane protein assembly factor BamB
MLSTKAVGRIYCLIILFASCCFSEEIKPQVISGLKDIMPEFKNHKLTQTIANNYEIIDYAIAKNTGEMAVLLLAEKNKVLLKLFDENKKVLWSITADSLNFKENYGLKIKISDNSEKIYFLNFEGSYFMLYVYNKSGKLVFKERTMCPYFECSPSGKYALFLGDENYWNAVLGYGGNNWFLFDKKGDKIALQLQDIIGNGTYKCKLIDDDNLFVERAVPHKELRKILKYVYLFSISAKKIIWETDIPVSVSSSMNQGIDNMGNFIVYGGQCAGENKGSSMLYLINKSNGKIIWKNIYNDASDFVKISEDGKYVLDGFRSHIYVHNIEDGNIICKLQMQGYIGLVGMRKISFTDNKVYYEQIYDKGSSEKDNMKCFSVLYDLGDSLKLNNIYAMPDRRLHVLKKNNKTKISFIDKDGSINVLEEK